MNRERLQPEIKWSTTGSGGWFLWKVKKFQLYKSRGVIWLSLRPSASQEVCSSKVRPLLICLYMEWVDKYIREYRYMFIPGPFAKFVDLHYYSESELCGGTMTVSFSKYLPWQAMCFLQRSTHFSKTCCRPLITSKFLASELPFHGWKSPEIAWGEIWIEFCVRLGKSGSVEPL
jgi:hypothetical protein